MPPFGTCFQSKVGPGYALQAATHGFVRRRSCRPRVTVVWPASRSLAPMRAPRLSLFRSAWDFMAEMEATMTWKALSCGRYLLALKHACLHVRPTSFEYCRSTPG
jgi:hypothetical protein